MNDSLDRVTRLRADLPIRGRHGHHASGPGTVRHRMNLQVISPRMYWSIHAGTLAPFYPVDRCEQGMGLVGSDCNSR